MSSFLGLDYSTPTTIRSNTRVYRGMTLSRKIQVNHSDSQNWTMSISLVPSYNDETRPSAARLSVHRSMNGTFESFTINMPQLPGVEDRISGTVANLQMRGVTSAGETDVAVDSTSTVTIPEGLFITIGSDKKVYQVTEDVTVLSSDTEAVLKVYPPLVTDTVNNNTIDTTPTIDVFYAANGTDSVTIRDGVLLEAVINVEEALV